MLNCETVKKRNRNPFPRSRLVETEFSRILVFAAASENLHLWDTSASRECSRHLHYRHVRAFNSGGVEARRESQSKENISLDIEKNAIWLSTGRFKRSNVLNFRLVAKIYALILHTILRYISTRNFPSFLRMASLLQPDCAESLSNGQLYEKSIIQISRCEIRPIMPLLNLNYVCASIPWSPE